MSYVDALFDKEKDIVHVSERDKNGNRVLREYAPNYIFYYPSSSGKYRSLYGQPLAKVKCRTYAEFMKEQRRYKNIHEGDVKPAVRILADNYLGVTAPKLNVCFWDIESAWDPVRGYSSTEEAFNPITAISIYNQWEDMLFTVAVPPKTLTMSEATNLLADIPNVMLFATEKEMLDTFLNLISDADILSGYNCSGYDVPYTVNRVKKVLSKEDTKRFCLWDQYPKKREYEKFGKKAITYDFAGRVNLDSLELYQKYTYEERHSYKLDSIGEYELNEKKTEYEGTLDQLYNNDFYKFIVYNRQDVALLNKLDKKLKFIDLANTIAHSNTVTLRATMGVVAVTEQALTNEAHRLGMIIPNRKHKDDTTETQAAGAYVAYPAKGLHDWIGSMDINSLYPSVIRALNMSPETIIGQLRNTYTKAEIDSKVADIEHASGKKEKGISFAAAWEGKFGSNEYELVMSKDNVSPITIDWEDGSSDELTGDQIYQLVFETGQKWMLSANGTLFTYEKEGLIPGLLKRWYSERKVMQSTLINVRTLEQGIPLSTNLLDKLNRHI